MKHLSEAFERLIPRYARKPLVLVIIFNFLCYFAFSNTFTWIE